LSILRGFLQPRHLFWPVAAGICLLLALGRSVSAVSFGAGDTVGAVRQIQVVGNKKIEVDAILAKIKTKAGEPLSRAQVSDDIRALHALGYFDDVAFDWNDGVVTIKVLERPTISKISFDGNDQVSTSDLKETIKVKEYSIFDVNKVKEDIALVQKLYEDKGFYLARVSYETKKLEKEGEVELIYRVSDYDKVRIKKITFINNQRFPDERLKAVLRNTKEGNFFSWISSTGNFKESAFKQDMQMLTYYYLNEGYVKFRYENPVVTVSEDKRWLFISIYVDEGERYTVGEIDFGGDLLFDKSDLAQTTEMKSGQFFSIQKRNDDIQKLTEKYQDLGYAFVNVIPKMNIRDDVRLVDIRYDFEKGDIVHFGEINVLGNSKTRDKVIRRELRVREGEKYHGTRLRLSRERVERLGFFNPGEVVFNTVTRKDKKDVVDLEIGIKERSTGTVSLGMGYGSIQKFFLTGSIAETNLFGRGQNLSLSLQYAADRKSRSLSLGFTEPYLMNSRWSAGFDVFLTSFVIPDRYLLFKKGFDLRFGHPLDRIDEDMYAYLNYKLETLELDEIDSRFPDLNANDDRGSLSAIGMSVVRDKRNNRFEPTKGNYESLGGEFAGVGGKKNYAKLSGEARFYYPLTSDLIFRTKFEAGHMFKTTDDNIPPAEKFYLGGPNNLKGYRALSITPRSDLGPDREGTPLGGVSELVYIAEIEYPLIREAGLKLVTFFDMGNAFASFSDMRRIAGLKKDVGFGFRWFSPIGPLRFEWGFPINPGKNDSNVEFNFFIGPPF